jgi:DNA or RNA helicases of superfamily II
MILRKHQAAVVEVCREILSGAPINEIILSVTPGGGKSFVPVILAENLIPADLGQHRLIADRICWIAPRDALKYQGEAEFLNPIWNTSKRIRAADNGNDLSRGCEGYVSTFQAVGANPECHLAEFKKFRYILFIDEAHHISDDAKWEKAIAPLVEAAVLVVYASGTLSRGDGEKIAFLPYKNGEIDLTNTETRRVVTYSRSEAIRDGAIMRVGFKLVDGESDWEELDGTKGSSKLSGEESAKALFTALRTDYANQLLDECLEDFFKELLVYPKAKMLVIAPNIAVAEAYHDYLAARGQFVRIATSDDSTTAKANINAFKRGDFNILVTVGMAYEGLNVPEITHICCLTHIRSMPWLEQCFARANRLAPGKLRAIVYAPADHMFKKAIKMIEREELVPLANPDEQMDLAGSSEEKRGEGTGEARPWIIPTGSTAYVDGAPVPEKPAVLAGLPDITPSEAEKILRKNIHDIITEVIEKTNNGSKTAVQKILYRRMRLQVAKPIAEMNSKELEKIYVWIMGVKKEMEKK